MEFVYEAAGSDSISEKSLFFAGDCVLADGNRSALFDSDLAAHIEAAGFSMANLEAPLRAGEGIEKRGPVLETADHTPATLRSCGFDGVTLANNHAMDYGWAGATRTLEGCDSAGLETVGLGDTRENALRALHRTIEGTDVAIVAVCEREFGVAERDRPGTAPIDAPQLGERIARAAADVDLVIVVAHGGIEFVPIPPAHWQDRLRSCIEAGADAVIAHHPHVPQGWERYGGAPICYSLGNFTFSVADLPTPPSAEWGYGVRLGFEDGEITTATIVPIERRGDIVGRAGERRDPAACRAHLDELSGIVGRYPSNRGYWQDLASRLYAENYELSLYAFGSTQLRAALSDPIGTAMRVAGDLFGEEREGKPDGADPTISGQELRLLNELQNESHSAVIRTALRVRTGIASDERTPAIATHVDELLDRMDEPLEPTVSAIAARRLRRAFRDRR